MRAAMNGGLPNTRDAREYRTVLLRALANLGDTQFVDDQLAAGLADAPERLRGNISRALNKPRWPNELCSQM